MIEKSTQAVKECPRCGQDHDLVEFFPLVNPTGGIQQWGMCPVTNQPLFTLAEVDFNTYFFIHGINNKAGSIHNWNSRAEDYIEQMPGPDRARHYSYTVGALDRWIWQGGFVKDVEELLVTRKYRKGEGLKLVGHSNGCEILKELMLKNPLMPVRELHLIAPAVEADFTKNGLNEVIANNKIGCIKIYCSREDSSLRKAQKTNSFLKFFNNKWGYGYLGLTGPTNLSESAKKVVQWRFFDPYDHSDYFKGANFEHTMQMITGEVPFAEPTG